MKEEMMLLKGELIGREVEVVESRDPSWMGKKGIIVDETKNTFKIEIDGKEKIIAKDIARFRFRIGNRFLEIEGSRLKYRPEERIKKAR